MFGPDLTCPGTKVHFIFRHKNPISGEYEEKHLKLAPKPAIDTLTKLYTLAVNPDNTYEVFVDGESMQKGSLLEDFDPPVNPSAEIDDPEDTKPTDWVDTKRISDSDAKKPDDWDEDAPYEIIDEDAVKPEGWLDDEPTSIPDPDSEKPEEWDDEEDGDWVSPSIPNPACEDAPGCGEWKRPNKPNPLYKGKWFAPMIDNPAYIGEWAPRKIPNPSYFEDLDPIKSLEKIGGIGIELWTMTEDIFFDNIYLGHSLEDAKALAAETFEIKKTLEATSKAAAEAKEEAEDQIVFKEDPVGFIREKVFEFIDMAQVDPVGAAKARPETAAGLALAVVTLFGMLAVFVTSLFGSQPKPVAKPSKKTDALTPDDKIKADSASVSKAGDDKKKDESGVKKRK